MANVVVVGAQWGDEGKGKIVDWLSERADCVVRFQGGHNAGHTLVIGDKTYKLSLLPSGIVRPGKLSIIGNGVVVDPWALKKEIGTLAAMGVAISRENLRIAENATLILPLHGELDRLREEAAGAQSIGTTMRGIGPAYEDKVGRRAIRAQDLANLDTLPAKIDRLLAHHNALRRGLGVAEVVPAELLAALKDIRDSVLPYVDTVWALLDAKRKAGDRILFEGAQGALLDNDHGTYPFVTSSNTIAAQAATGSGIGPGALHYVLGITKAYTTRVGAGPFPTELLDATGELIGQKGHEFGTVTGRKRRCGWFDACLVRQTIKVAGIDRHRADQARRARRLRGAEGVRPLRARRPRDRAPAGGPVRASPRQADLRDHARLARDDARRPQLGRSAGSMHQIRQAHRGADRGSGRALVDEPGARGHDFGQGSVRGVADGRSRYSVGSLVFMIGVITSFTWYSWHSRQS